MGEWLAEWYPAHEASLAPKTQAQYRSTFRRWVLPSLGDRPSRLDHAARHSAPGQHLGSRGQAIDRPAPLRRSAHRARRRRARRPDRPLTVSGDQAPSPRAHPAPTPRRRRADRPRRGDAARGPVDGLARRHPRAPLGRGRRPAGRRHRLPARPAGDPRDGGRGVRRDPQRAAESAAGRRQLPIPAPLVEVLAAHLAMVGLTAADPDR